MFTISSFKAIENKHDVYRGKESIKKFWEFLREHVIKTVNFKKKNMKLLTNEQKESCENAKIDSICKETFEDKYAKGNKYCKVRDNDYYTGENRGVAHSICNLKYSVPEGVLIVFHNGPNYDYYFIIKALVEEFEGHFTCLEEYTHKHITFSVPIEKEVTGIDKKGKEITKTISYKLQSIDSARFIASSSPNL